MNKIKLGSDTRFRLQTVVVSSVGSLFMVTLSRLRSCIIAGRTNLHDTSNAKIAKIAVWPVSGSVSHLDFNSRRHLQTIITMSRAIKMLHSLVLLLLPPLELHLVRRPVEDGQGERLPLPLLLQLLGLALLLSLLGLEIKFIRNLDYEMRSRYNFEHNPV